MIIAVTTLAALCFVFASLLVLAHKKLHVDEDPRIDAAHQLLPQTNCGACGYPGCRAFAEALVGGDVLPDDDEKKLIAALLAISTGIEDANALGVPAEIGQKLLDCYRGLGANE